MDQAANITLGLTRKSLEARIIRACAKCQAPGIYTDRMDVWENWRGCYRAGIVAGSTFPVGPVCPNCGAARPDDLEYGELSASMPRWAWNCVLAFKWTLVKLKTGQRRFKERFR